MSTQEQMTYRHKKYSQRKRNRDDDENTVFSTDSDSSMEPDQEQITANLAKQRKIQTSKLTPKQKFKIEKTINEIRIRIQLIDLNDNQPETIDLTKDDTEDEEETKFRRSITFVDPTDSNGNILLAKRSRSQISSKTSEKESLSDDEINEKLLKLDIPLPVGPPPNRRVTFGGFSHAPSPRKTNMVTLLGGHQAPKILKNTLEQSDMDRIKLSAKKMGRSKTIKEINIEDEWRIYKAANLSLSEFANRTSSFGTKKY